MSILSILALCTFLLILFSQFGHRLAARNSLAWWCIALFILTAAINPEIYRPLTQKLGIALISNFVLAAMVMFLLLQLVELSAESTTQMRKFRDLVSRMAVDEFMRRRPPNQLDMSGSGKTLVILPCFNEEESLPFSILDVTSQVQQSSGELDFCYINDGSLDRSIKILRQSFPQGYANHTVNIGVAGVLLTGFRIADMMNYDYVVQCDSDGQHPIPYIPELVQYAKQNEIDLLIGSRFSESMTAEQNTSSTTLSRVLGIVVLRQFLKIFGRKAAIFDPTSGFRVYSQHAQSLLLKHMPDEYPEPESIAILSLYGAKIAEYKVEMLPRQAGISTLNGLKSARFMIKVITALVGLRLRSFRL